MSTKKVMRCVVCHKSSSINTTDESWSSSDVVQENWVCAFCALRTDRIKIPLKCSSCGRQYQTKVLLKNKDKFGNDWVCPACAVVVQKEKIIKNKKHLKDGGCSGCTHSIGICDKPDVACSLSVDFVQYCGSDVCSISKDCTIFCVHDIDKERDDIHCFKYSILWKPRYFLDKKNVVIIKRRIGSRQNYNTSILVFAYNQKQKKFIVVLDNNYSRKDNWIINTKNYLLENYFK